MARLRHLYLLRHAKSSWKHPELADHDRPLAPRGRRATKALARHLREQRIEPRLVLCSTAARARQTLEGIEPGLRVRSVKVERRLYGASAQTLLDRLQAVRDDVDSVMLIGHNPGLQELALDLLDPTSDPRGIDTKYPTGALAVLAFPGARWRELAPGKAELVAFVRPRDLLR